MIWGGVVLCACVLTTHRVFFPINTRKHKFIGTFTPTAISSAAWDRQDEQYLIKTLAAGWRKPFLLEQIVQRSRQ